MLSSHRAAGPRVLGPLHDSMRQQSSDGTVDVENSLLAGRRKDIAMAHARRYLKRYSMRLKVTIDSVWRRSLACALMLCMPAVWAQEASSAWIAAPLTILAGVRRVGAAGDAGYHHIRVEGTVLWVDSSATRLVLQDDSGAEALELDWGGNPFKPGHRVRLEGVGTEDLSSTNLTVGADQTYFRLVGP